MRVVVIYVSCITRMDIIYIHEQNIHSNQNLSGINIRNFHHPRGIDASYVVCELSTAIIQVRVLNATRNPTEMLSRWANNIKRNLHQLGFYILQIWPYMLKYSVLTQS